MRGKSEGHDALKDITKDKFKHLFLFKIQELKKKEIQLCWVHKGGGMFTTLVKGFIYYDHFGISFMFEQNGSRVCFHFYKHPVPQLPLTKGF